MTFRNSIRTRRLWHLYGARRTFIDGRHFNPPLFCDFHTGQPRETSFRAMIEKYKLDSFILPSIPRSGIGMQNVHRWLDGHAIRR